MDIPGYERRLDELFCEAFSTNDPVMLDWVQVKFELKSLRAKAETQQSNAADGKEKCGLCSHPQRDFLVACPRLARRRSNR